MKGLRFILAWMMAVGWQMAVGSSQQPCNGSMPGVCASQQTPGAEQGLPVVCDIDAAREVCDALPLDVIEGIWVYPDDNVTVLVRRIPMPTVSSLPEYQLMVVEATDCRLSPGDVIGTLSAAPEATRYTLTLHTSKKEGVMKGSASCMATLSKEGDTMTLTREKSKFRLRINFNPNSLLPALWRSLVRFGISFNGGEGNNRRPAPGMVKIYPSYDGNGSSRRSPRYL